MRGNKMMDDVSETYDKMSKFYDTFAKPEKKYIYQCLDMLQVEKGSKVLEIGFGTGDAILKLVNSVDVPGNVYGIDISKGMLKVTQSKLKDSGIEGVKLSLGDARDIPFEDGSFDYVFMSFTLELFKSSDIQVVLRESYRVLKEDGKIGIVALSDRGSDNLMTRMYKWAHMKFPSYVDCRPIPLQDDLIKAGFIIETVEEEEMWDLPVDLVVSKK